MRRLFYRMKNLYIISINQNKAKQTFNFKTSKMERFREKLSNLTIDQKQKLLFVYVYALIFLILIGVSSIYSLIKPQIPAQQKYTKFVKQYAKEYSGIQQTYRRFIFYQTYNDVIFHNKKQIDQNYVKGINQFSDLTKAQFQQLYLMITTIATQLDYIQIADFQFDSYDWSQKYLPPIVKNMKGYDVGHVFATVSVLQFWVNRKRLQKQPWITLSEQQIIDCCEDCGVGQQPHKPLRYVIQNGVSTDEKYPYTSAIYNQAKQQCKTKNQVKPYKPIKDFQRIKKCKDLSQAIQISPIIVGVDAREFKEYNSGIVSQCGKKRSHYMLLVGKSIGHWKLKNNWGKRWGQQGYIRLKLGNTCVICLHAYRPIFDQNV